jgi:DNA replication protein DnaC
MEVVAGKGARRCRCRAEEWQAKLLEDARIPLRYEHCSLANYQVAAGNGTQLQAFNYAFKLIDEYPVVDRGLLLMEPIGTGKTHLSVDVLRGLVKKGVPARSTNSARCSKRFRLHTTPSRRPELKVLAPVYETEVLVLDEVGASKPTDWVRDTMMQVIGTRYNSRRLTVFTTNYFDALHNALEETLEDRIGVRLRSRLHEMCRTVIIEGEDYRRKLDAKL